MYTASHSNQWLQILFYVLLFTGLAPFLGTYIANIFEGKTTWVHRYLGWLERLSYKAASINPYQEMTPVSYGKALLLFNVCTALKA